MIIKRLYISSILCLVFIFVTTTLQAQVNTNREVNDSILNVITDIDGRIKEISGKKPKGGLILHYQLDSLADYQTIISNLGIAYRDEKGLIVYPFQPSELDESLTFRDTVIFDPALLPVVFEGKILPSGMDFMPKDSVFGSPKKFHLIDPNETFAPALDQAKRVEELRRGYYTRNLEKVTVNALTFSDSPVIKEQVVEKKSIFKELLSTNEVVDFTTPEVETTKIKKVFWKKEGEHELKISQNAFSDNWNGSGGDNNFAVLSYQKINFNYKRNKFMLNNTVDWKLDVSSLPSTTKGDNENEHKYNIKDDYVRVYSVAGLEAFKNWSYSMKFEAKTQIFKSYPANSKERKMSFLSPLIVNLGVGMSYNLEKKSPIDKYKNIKLSIDISPLSYNYTYVKDVKVKATRFGIDEGDHAKVDIGSNININFVYNFNRYASYSNRMSYFTNYSKIKAESENKINFAINQYFSTSINLFLRVDDAIGIEAKDDKWGYFQYNEVVGFGLGYKW